MPSIVDDEESIFFIVIGHEVCHCSIGLDLRQNIQPVIYENAPHVIVVSIFKNTLQTFDLSTISSVSV
jgi:hypothetical protein